MIGPILVLLLDPHAAIGTALITQVFGVLSGVSAYMQRRLINYKLALLLLIASVPLSLVGAMFAGQILSVILRAIFGVGLLIAGICFLRNPASLETQERDITICDVFPVAKAQHKLVAADGQEYSYTLCNTREGMGISCIGGLFMGFAGAG